MRMDEKALKAAMKRMGIQSQEIPATEVIIKSEGKDIIISQPQVTKVNMMGQDTFQIIGHAHERKRSDIIQEDINTVMQQANVDEKVALAALEFNNGDLAAAIISLKRN